MRKSLRLVYSVLEEKALYLELDAGLFFDELLSKTGDLTLSFLMFGWYGDVPEKSFCGIFSELSGVEGVGFESGADWRGVFEGATTPTGMSAC